MERYDNRRGMGWIGSSDKGCWPILERSRAGLQHRSHRDTRRDGARGGVRERCGGGRKVEDIFAASALQGQGQK